MSRIRNPRFATGRIATKLSPLRRGRILPLGLVTAATIASMPATWSEAGAIPMVAGHRGPDGENDPCPPPDPCPEPYPPEPPNDPYPAPYPDPSPGPPGRRAAMVKAL